MPTWGHRAGSCRFPPPLASGPALCTAKVPRCPAEGDRDRISAPGQVPRLAQGTGWEADKPAQRTPFPGLGWAPCLCRYLDTAQGQPAQPSASRWPPVAGESKEGLNIRRAGGRLPQPRTQEGQPCPERPAPAKHTCPGRGQPGTFPGDPRVPPPSRVVSSTTVTPELREGMCARRQGTSGVGHCHLCPPLFGVLACKMGTLTEPTPAALTAEGRARSCRALARPPAAGSLRTGQPPPTGPGPGPGSCRSPIAVLGREREARPPPHRGHTRLWASPTPGLTCPAAHRAGAPHGGPRPGQLQLRPEVGEGDVRAAEVAVLVTIAPVNLHRWTRARGRSSGHLGSPPRPPPKPRTFHSSMPAFFCSGSHC